MISFDEKLARMCSAKMVEYNASFADEYDSATDKRKDGVIKKYTHRLPKCLDYIDISYCATFAAFAWWNYYIALCRDLKRLIDETTK